MNNFIKQYAPGMEYGVVPWPAAKAGVENFTVADADVLMIPRGSKHPKEAWEFIKFVSSINPNAQTQSELQGMELLCYGQEKNSPLRQWSPFFEKHHPHPYIHVFRQLAQSPNAVHYPKMGIWSEYRREMDSAFDNVRLLYRTPEQALAFCQKRVSESWELHQRSIARRKDALAENTETQRIFAAHRHDGQQNPSASAPSVKETYP